jgi:membrane associated rhomboid family serine protease
MDIWTDIKTSFHQGSVITRLIYLNLAVFLVFRIIHVIFFLAGKPYGLMQWFELPADPGIWILQPWSILTYMFLHFDFLHILFNLLVLYWFGRIFLDYYTPNQLVGLYLLGGLAGGVLYMAAYNLFPVFEEVVSTSFLLGASASIIAILVAAALRDPAREVRLMLIGMVQLRYLALFMIFSYIIGISVSNAGGNLAHLGGVFAGWFFVFLERRGNDVTAPFSVAVNRIGRLFRPKTSVRVVHRNPARDDYAYNRQKAADHEELNRILDKIGEEGYDSLTKTEKETLFRHGK